jgi:F0F1-type ATP synthase membrane subunit c/vacuolar-type H+-ATPase subunit K
MSSTTDLSDAKRFLLALGGGLILSLACLTAAIGPANATQSAPAAACRPALM